MSWGYRKEVPVVLKVFDLFSLLFLVNTGISNDFFPSVYSSYFR